MERRRMYYSSTKVDFTLLMILFSILIHIARDNLEFIYPIYQKFLLTGTSMIKRSLKFQLSPKNECKNNP